MQRAVKWMSTSQRVLTVHVDKKRAVSSTSTIDGRPLRNKKIVFLNSKKIIFIFIFQNFDLLRYFWHFTSYTLSYITIYRNV